MKNFFIILILFFLLTQIEVQAQKSQKDKTVTYEELYDSPFEINKLFIHVMPIYGELFTTNVTAGFGIAAQYYHKELFDIYAHGRSAYVRQFDITRDAGFKNTTVDNECRPYTYFELIGTYHIVDREEDTETKFILYSNRYKGDKWAATVPLQTIIPTKMRRIYGVRFGGLAYSTAIDYNRLREKQEFNLINQEGTPLDFKKESIYADMKAQGFYIGGSMTLIKNVAVQPDRVYSTLVNDLIFTTYIDIAFTPFIQLEDIVKNGIPYTTDEVKTSILGIRAGMEGKFNRDLGWSYGAEIGTRPGLKGEGFYITAKISIPVFSTLLDNKVESFGK